MNDDVIVSKQVIILWTIVFSFAMGMLSGWAFVRMDFRRQAIEVGAAYYSPQTAKFTWVTNKPPIVVSEYR
jgi:hypothetical protein